MDKKIKINVKPLSVNQCWQGRRFKTVRYKNYERELLFILPRKLKMKIKKNDKLKIEITAGLSSANADVDNIVKPFLDILQKKYNFDDRQVYEMILKKEKTAKGKEFVEFFIKKIEFGKKGGS